MTTRLTLQGRPRLKPGPKPDPKRLGELKYGEIDDTLTSAAGLPAMLELFSKDPLFLEFEKCLPARVGNNTYGTERIALVIWLGFLRGYDCIEDLADFEFDPAVMQKFGEEVIKPRAIGNYLRDFSETNNEDLNGFLRAYAKRARERFFPEEPVIMDVDSTAHEQRGKQIEGVCYNYKNLWCLDSLVAFDQWGFCHGMKLRPGNTFSSEGASDFIREIFPILPVDEVERRRQKAKRFLRADSAFCEQKTIHACLERGVIFTLSAHGRTGWKDRVKAGAIQDWKPWDYDEKELKKAAESGVSLPKVELGSLLYEPTWAENLRFYIVVKRTWVPKKLKKENKKSSVLADEEENPTFLDGEWLYYGVLTNWNLFHADLQEIMTHHQRRGHGENFIKEKKISYDLKHFPCKPLKANHAYGLVGLVAHNFMRMIAFLDNPEKPHFAKQIRKKLILIPGKVVYHAKQWWIKIPTRCNQEVIRLQHAWEKAVLLSPTLH